MDLDPNLLGLAGLLLSAGGIVIGFLVSRHYYRRQQDKRLTPFLHLASAVFQGIDPSVREKLRISYNGAEIHDLFELQVVVANDGERPVTCIEPLTVVIPAGVKALDVAILHREPSALKVDVLPWTVVPGEPTRIVFPFPVLNKGECFVAKFLLEGQVDVRELSFEVVAEDLPRRLPLRDLPSEVFEKQALLDKGALAFGIALLGVAALMGYGIALIWQARPDMFPFPWASYRFSLPNAALLVIWLVQPIAYLLLGILALLVGFGLVGRNRSSFRLPAHMKAGRPPSVTILPGIEVPADEPRNG